MAKFSSKAGTVTEDRTFVEAQGFAVKEGRVVHVITCGTCDAAYEWEFNAPLSVGGKLHLLNHRRGHDDAR